MKNKVDIDWVLPQLSGNVLEKNIDENKIRKLLDTATIARNNAYARYSNFSVGSAVLIRNGAQETIITGCNVENASYGATMCAERVAIFSAVCQGLIKLSDGLTYDDNLLAIAIVADYHKPIPPCGMCRQVIAEFSKNVLVVMGNTRGQVNMADIKKLLPYQFELA